MKKKILIDLERLRYPYTGLANVFRNIAKGIEVQFPSNDVCYFGPEKELKKYISAEKIIPYQKWHKYFESFSHKFQLIHISNQGAPYFRKNYKNAIKILTLHDLNFLHENLSVKKRKKMHHRINKSFETVDYLVCISEFVKQDLLKNKHLFNFKKLKDIVVIHNGIEFPEQKKYDLGQFRDLRNKKYILNIGVLFDKKNQKSLVEMLPYIDEDLVLLASGEKEPYATKVREIINELGVSDRVHILKNVSEEEKYALIQHCEALCHPSIAEGFGIPPIEAMALGKPVFLSRYTSLPEIGGENAFYFDDFEPKEMANIFHSKMKLYRENKTEMQQELRKWASQFDYRTMAKNYYKFYQSLLQ